MKNRIRDQRRRDKRMQDPAAYAIYCQKERERNQARKKEGIQTKFKSSKDLTARERRSRRKQQKKWDSNRKAKNIKKAAESSVREGFSRDDEEDDIKMLEEAAVPSASNTAVQESGDVEFRKDEQTIKTLAIEINKLKNLKRKRSRQVYKQKRAIEAEKEVLKKKNQSQRRTIERLKCQLDAAEEEKGRSSSPTEVFKRSIQESNLPGPLQKQIVSRKISFSQNYFYLINHLINYYFFL